MSTGTSGRPNENSSTQAAVLRPTPGSAAEESRASLERRVAPARRGRRRRARSRICLIRTAFVGASPPGRIASSTSSSGASRTSSQDSKRSRRRRVGDVAVAVVRVLRQHGQHQLVDRRAVRAQHRLAVLRAQAVADRAQRGGGRGASHRAARQGDIGKNRPVEIAERTARGRRPRRPLARGAGRRRRAGRSTCTASRPARGDWLPVPRAHRRRGARPARLRPLGQAGRLRLLDRGLRQLPRGASCDHRRARPRLARRARLGRRRAGASPSACPSGSSGSWCSTPVPLLPGYRWHRVARAWRTPLVGELMMGFTIKRPRRCARRAAARARPTTSSTRSEALRPRHPARDPKLYRSAPEDVLARAGDAARRDRCPALVLWGEATRTSPPSSAAATRRRSAGEADARGARGRGHWPWLERPERRRSGGRLPAASLPRRAARRALLRHGAAATAAPTRRARRSPGSPGRSQADALVRGSTGGAARRRSSRSRSRSST